MFSAAEGHPKVKIAQLRPARRGAGQSGGPDTPAHPPLQPPNQDLQRICSCEGDAVKGQDAPSSSPGSGRGRDGWKAGGGGSPAFRGPAVAHLALEASEDHRAKAHGDPLSPLCLADCCGPRAAGVGRRPGCGNEGPGWQERPALGGHTALCSNLAKQGPGSCGSQLGQPQQREGR